MFIIEDEAHSEYIAEVQTWEEAITELKRLSKIPWDKEPNQAPCISWKTCGREYIIIEFDGDGNSAKQLRRVSALGVSAESITWDPGFANL